MPAATDVASSDPLSRHLPAGPVVVGFDGSPPSRDALALGRDLARLAGARLVIGVVHRLDVPLVADAALLEEVRRRDRQEAEDLVEEAASVLGGEEGVDWARCVVAASSAARGLQFILEDRRAGIAVLGHSHRHGAGVAVPGTTAGRLLQGAPCAVAIAPRGWAARGAEPIGRIGAGVDGSDEAQAALEWAAAVAEAAGGSLRAIGVFRPPSPANPVFTLPTGGYADAVAELRERVQARLSDGVDRLERPPAAPVALEAIDGDPGDALVELSGSLDLLVVGSRRYGPLRSVLAGDVATRLATDARCALVIVPRGAGGAPAG